jgi:hypothetical protein
MKNQIHKTARYFALKHRINLGRYENGYYFVRDPKTLEILHISLYPEAQSALAMMRRFLRLHPVDHQSGYRVNL